MTIGSATPAQTTSLKQGFLVNDIHTLVAQQFGVDVESVTSETHFTIDLGADLLDRVELMLVIEDQFAVQITDDDVEQIQLVGDLIRHVQNTKRAGYLPAGGDAGNREPWNQFNV